MIAGRTTAAAGLLAVTFALGGCASLAAPGGGSAQSSRLAQAQATHEYSSRAPAAEAASGGFQAPVEAIQAFVTVYINWTADSVTDHMRSLAASSVGRARAAMELAAARTVGDYELKRGGIANSGTVEAIAPLFGHSDQYVVITKEVTTATATTAYQGLRPAWHLALVTVAQLSGGQWVVSGWQPES